MKKFLSLAFIGALLSSASLVRAVEFVFHNDMDKDVVLHPNYDSTLCTTNPFRINKKSSYTFDAGKACYMVLKSIDLTVPDNPHLIGTIDDLPHDIFGSYSITIKEENNMLTATFKK